jgi:hypothetical protein
MVITNDVVIDKISIKISIEQIASFLSMINNTSNILEEKYLNRILNENNILEEEKEMDNIIPLPPVLEKEPSSIESAKKLTETFKVFSSRYAQEFQAARQQLGVKINKPKCNGSFCNTYR